MKFASAKKAFTPAKYGHAIRPRRNLAGFTLTELLIVTVIIGIIAAFIVVNMNSSRARARDTKRVADLEALDSAINRYYREVGHYPDLPDGCGTAGINGVASDVVTSLEGICPSVDNYIKGLVSAYISKLPVDGGPQVFEAGKQTRGFVYIHSNINVQNLECYKIMVLNPESPKRTGYRSIWDPAHDGGANDNIVDGTNISAWSKYSRGCAAK